jgi:hypothetical protein
MFSRLSRLAVLAVAVAAPAAFAQDKTDSAPKASKGPAVLVRVQSVNDLLKTADYVGTLLPDDAKNQLKQGTDFARALIDDKTGLAGVDVKNPIGLYVTFGEDFDGTPPVVVLIPVADRDTFLTTLEQQAMLKVEAPKDKDGVYQIPMPPQSPVPLYFRFANGYVYGAIDAAHLDPKVLAKPADVLGGRPEHLVSATLRIDRLPEKLRTMALAGLENALAKGKDQPVPNETPAMKEFKEKFVDTLAANIKDVLESGEEAALRINVDPKAEEFALELELSGVKGKKLARDIQSIRDNKSVVGGALASGDTAFSWNLSVGLPAGLKKSWGPVADDAMAQAMKEANIPGEVMAKAEPFFNALKPTVKAGELDVGFAFVGPDKDDKYTLVAGLKVAEGKKLEGVIKEAMKDLPPEASGFFKMDEETLPGGVKLHRLATANEIGKDPNGVKVFGKSDGYLAFRDDLVVVAVGPGAKDAVKKAVASKPADVGISRLQIHLARLAAMMGDDAKQLAAAKAAAEKVFGPGGSKADLIKFSIDGGDSLKVKVSAQGKAIQFLAEVGAATQKKEN